LEGKRVMMIFRDSIFSQESERKKLALGNNSMMQRDVSSRHKNKFSV
jgi:hypothetical protein